MRGEVVGAQRLLDPGEVERGELADRTLGLLERPALVGVDHEPAVGSDHVAHGADALDVVGEVGAADLDLHRVEARASTQRPACATSSSSG